MIHEIGETAGKVYKHLEANGKTKLTDLAKTVDAEAETIKMAVGWLAREGKIKFEKVKKAVVVSLHG